MSDYYSEQLLQGAARGNLEDCRKALAQNIDINYQDTDGNTALFHAIQNSQIETVRFLLNNEASFEISNNQQQTPLHVACEKCNKEIILLLLTSGADPNVKNLSGQKPGDGQMEIKTFMNNIMNEKPAFGVLKAAQKQKLLTIFEDIDHDNQKQIDIHKAIKFNKYIEDINDSVAERDAKDFLKSVAVCNGQRVNQDEWLFGFSKLFAVEPTIFEKFIEDYDKVVSVKNKCRLQGLAD